MKQKLLASGLALSLLFGGATYSSASITASKDVEQELGAFELKVDDSVQPMLWVAVGRGVAMGVGWVLGESAARKVIGNNTAPVSDLDYEDMKVSFDN